MKCFECGHDMNSSSQTRLYLECGLPKVFLHNVEVRTCPACGETEFVIPGIEKRHKTIAMVLIHKRSRFTGSEVKFLRKYLGWSGVDFARHMGVTPECVSRWENDREPIGPVADRLLRLKAARGASDAW